MSSLLRVSRYVFLLLLVVTSTVAMTLVFYLHGSLPKLDGTLIVPGLRAKVELERDIQGIPSLSAVHREDIAYGLGFLHAQERFFQMDLQRRQAAGEVAALLGSRALIADRAARRHDFRRVARRALADATVQQAELLDAYARGVNQGLAALRQPPLEYLVVGQQPAPWQAVDSLLVVLNQTLILQGSPVQKQLNEVYLAEGLPADWYGWMTANTDVDLRLPTFPLANLIGPEIPAIVPLHPAPQPSGHQWAVSAEARANANAPLLTTAVYLPQSLPNHWYRAGWRMPESTRMVRGVTLPGVPLMVMGSNGHLSWSLVPGQDSGARLVRLEVDNNSYRTPTGWKPFRERRERIAVQGSVAQVMTIRDTDWGPVVGQDHLGNWLALQWSAHDPDALNLDLFALEDSSGTDAALALATPTPTPFHLMVADRAGDIAWAQVGPWPAVPSGRVRDGATTTPSDPDLQSGLASSAEQLWRIDSEVVQSDFRATATARETQLRSALQSARTLDEADMLALQLNDQALWLQPWAQHLSRQLRLLEPESEPLRALRDAAIGWLTTDRWRARPHSNAYYLVRAYYDAMLARTLGPVLETLRHQYPQFDPDGVSIKPRHTAWLVQSDVAAHHLPPRFATWAELYADAAEAALMAVEEMHQTATPEAYTEVQFKHPLADRVPGLDWLLNIAPESQPGDPYVLRFQDDNFGASLRMTVSPGAESQGLLHMPGGQSSHPFSPYYRSGHEAWANGLPSPFVSSETRYQMTLIPQR